MLYDDYDTTEEYDTNGLTVSVAEPKTDYTPFIFLSSVVVLAAIITVIALLVMKKKK